MEGHQALLYAVHRHLTALVSVGDNQGAGSHVPHYGRLAIVAHRRYRLTPEQFDAAVEEALELIPAQFREAMANVAVLVEAEPPEGEEELLGVYDGVPLTDWGQDWDGSLPDRVTVFQGPLERMCATREELLDEIAVTVVHEMAHHFGIDEERLHELGWG